MHKAICTVCGQAYGGFAAHSLTKTEAKAATYTETGNNEYYTCSVCQKVFKDAAGTQETTVEAETIAKLTRPSSGGSSSHGDRDPSYAVTAPSTKNGKVPADVLPGSYCYDAVAWALENGIINGLADGTFGVNNTCTRGQSVTFLYRAMGTAPTTVNGFTDVAADSFCADAVAWAVKTV